jgi:hypothetical protein
MGGVNDVGNWFCFALNLITWIPKTHVHFESTIVLVVFIHRTIILVVFICIEQLLTWGLYFFPLCPFMVHLYLVL